MASSSTRNKVFISYSHKDASYLTRLHAHLAYYERNGLVDYWDDTRLSVGDDWEQKIADAIQHACVCILLVSADYLASSYVAEKELPHMFARARNDGARIFTVVLSPCGFNRTGLRQFQAINDASRPLTAMSRHNREQVWDSLAQMVADAIQVAQPEPEPRKQPELGAEAELTDVVMVPRSETLELEPIGIMTFDESLSYGSQLIGEEKYALATALLSSLVQVMPENLRAWFLYGVALHKQGRHSQAGQALDRAFDLDYRQSTAVTTVFVVEDDPAMQSMFRLMLEDRLPGYAVEVATDGVDALDKLATIKPAWLLLDYMMPRMDGLEVLRRLAGYADTYPVIFTTAHNLSRREVAAKTGYPLQQLTFLLKPFTIEQFDKCVDYVMKRATSGRTDG